ncbi:hypothetical protein BOTNAR_0258g00150 [Botryotinia narcissicola]|uniref:Uncharacterized protein n=1 Tax=Botryotinia narcissicola TaxID=278944 RepID=A0A4Z1I5R3_9HELO|nr:hypothetical protein BOTNAR_0258g00150 [Botryotinia narcissicola]
MSLVKSEKERLTTEYLGAYKQIEETQSRTVLNDDENIRDTLRVAVHISANHSSTTFEISLQQLEKMHIAPAPNGEKAMESAV